MAQQTRMQGEYGYSHLTVKGNGGQILFEAKEDFLYCLSLMEKYSREEQVTICAYCLMENHAHILVFDLNNRIPMFMKKLGGTYTAWFNRKYEHSGHVFQGRYGRFNVESDDYLLRVFRYVLRNPQNAGICPLTDYPWSSYKAYGCRDSFVDTYVLTEMLGSWDEYAEYMASAEDDNVEFEQRKHDDEWAKHVIKTELGLDIGTKLQEYPRDERDAAIRRLRERGLTIRQIERLTGINRGTIQRVSGCR